MDVLDCYYENKFNLKYIKKKQSLITYTTIDQFLFFLKIKINRPKPPKF